MREFLKTKGFKMTPQRELIFRAFFELGEHVTVDELYSRVREKDSAIGYSTVWRNLKLICKVGLAEEVNLGDGVTRYDRITRKPHGHFYCEECKKLTEFDMSEVKGLLDDVAHSYSFQTESMKVEIRGRCKVCAERKSHRAVGNRIN
jgi:Fur family ferric uptake transcriptional regulator